MAQILTEIVAAKKVELDRLKVDVPLSEVERRIRETKAPLNLAGALWSDSVRVIAEVKRASPAKGLLRADLDPAALASSYANNGAAAVSVLTNKDHFQGSIEDLEAVHGAVNPRGIPVLRKEFIFDTYQVYEARAHGADAVLLIVAMLDPGLLGELRSLTQELWMQSLVEVHDEAQLEQALAVDAEIIGINNRDLRTFKTDLEVTERLAPAVPAGKIVVSESGVSSRDSIDRVRAAGAHAVLVGEALVTAADPGARLRGLV